MTTPATQPSKQDLDDWLKPYKVSPRCKKTEGCVAAEKHLGDCHNEGGTMQIATENLTKRFAERLEKQYGNCCGSVLNIHGADLIEELDFWMWQLAMRKFAIEHQGERYPGDDLYLQGGETWRQYYDDGYSPEDAVREDMTYWES